MEHYITDIELTVPNRKPVDRTIKQAIPVPTKTRERVRYSDGLRHPVKVTKLEVVV